MLGNGGTTLARGRALIATLVLAALLGPCACALIAGSRVAADNHAFGPPAPQGPVGAITGGWVNFTLTSPLAGPQGPTSLPLTIATSSPAVTFPAGPGAAPGNFPSTAQAVLGDRVPYLRFLARYFPGLVNAPPEGADQTGAGLKGKLFVTQLSLEGVSSNGRRATYRGTGLTVYVDLRKDGQLATTVKVTAPRQLVEANGLEGTFVRWEGSVPEHRKMMRQGARTTNVEIVESPSTAGGLVKLPKSYVPGAAAAAVRYAPGESPLDRAWVRQHAADASIRQMQEGGQSVLDLVLAQVGEFRDALAEQGAKLPDARLAAGQDVLARAVDQTKKLALQETAGPDADARVARATALMQEIRELEARLRRAARDAAGKDYGPRRAALALQESARTELLPRIAEQVVELAREVSEIAKRAAGDK